MTVSIEHFSDDFAPRFKNYQNFMVRKVREILLVSSLYDACIINEDCRLADRIAHEYHDLDLTHPPTVTWAASAKEALEMVESRDFDLVITMYRLADMNAFALGRELKRRSAGIPVVLLTHEGNLPAECVPGDDSEGGVDRIFAWSGDAELLVSIIKSVEDHLNAENDVLKGGVRVILLAEGVPSRLSRILSALYREIMLQTQAVIEEGLNEEHRMLRRRARAKVLLAGTLGDARRIYEQYRSKLMGMICEKTLVRDCEPDPGAGLSFLKHIRDANPALPFLIIDSGDEKKLRESPDIPSASILDLESDSVSDCLRHFLQHYLGFGPFVFRMKDGREVGRAHTLAELEAVIPTIPDASIYHHCSNNDFSRWLYARSEFLLADRLRLLGTRDFSDDPAAMKTFLTAIVHARRSGRQKGVVVDFKPEAFEPEMEFVRIGTESMGGKARGLAFLAAQLQQKPEILEQFEDGRLYVPNTLVLSADIFDAFIEANRLRINSRTHLSDEEIAARFLESEMPAETAEALRAYLRKISWPLAVRSSSLLEDSLAHPFAGIYRTYMLPNADPDPEERYRQLSDAVKLVFASTFFKEPRAFARRTGRRPDEEKMAVVIQKMVGSRYGDLFYPAISGVAQSYNYYPVSPMTPEDGIANIAMGLGITVVGGERSLRFCPKYPQNLPQFSTVDDILANAQRHFYGLKMGPSRMRLNTFADATLDKREIADVAEREALEWVAGTYLPEEHRVKDSLVPGGHPVVTFARILKHRAIPLPEILVQLLELGEKGMGGPVDIEFSVNFPSEPDGRPELALLQIRPMAARKEMAPVQIDAEDVAAAVCYSANALGNGVFEGISDIVFVKPEDFDPSRSPEIAREIGGINAQLAKDGRQYLLIGPGRWGTQDPWLGVPVQWADISGTAAIVETTHESFRPDPSQGSHFFHNLTSLNMAYFTISEEGDDFIRWEWLRSQPVHKVTRFLSHVRLDHPVTVKVDGKSTRGVIKGR